MKQGQTESHGCSERITAARSATERYNQLPSGLRRTQIEWERYMSALRDLWDSPDATESVWARAEHAKCKERGR